MTRPASTAYAAKPSTPLRLSVWDRLWDAWDARSNASASPPRPNPEDPRPTTPRLDAIDQHHRDAIQGEWLAFLRDTAADRVTLARLEQQVQVAKLLLQEAATARREAAAGEVEVSARPGEESLTEQDIARRRHASHRRRVAALDAHMAAAARNVDAQAAQIAELRQQIQERLAAAQTRAQRIHERDAARIDRYRAVLCRRHPDGQQLNTILCGPGLTLPSWVALDPESAAGTDMPWAA